MQKTIEYNRKTNQLKLMNGEDCLLEAAFNYDIPDRTALLSFAEGEDVDSENAKLICDEAAKEVSKLGNAKLYVTVGDKVAKLIKDDKEYRGGNIDRLWVLTDAEKPRKIVSKKFDEADREKLEVITDKDAIKKFAKEIGDILQRNTYWHEEGCDVEKALSIIDSASIAYLLMYEGKPIGFRRLLSNGEVSYLSDFVIDEPYTGKGYATFLTEYIYNNSLSQTPITILTAARGSEVAPIIAKKAGFELSNEKNHQYGEDKRLYFRWCPGNEKAKSIFMKEDQKAREADKDENLKEEVTNGV